AFAFDIDGVLIKGSKVLPPTRKMLQFISGENPLGIKVPFICLTNGGGVTEKQKAEQLSDMWSYAADTRASQISPDRLVLAHSPMRALAETYADKLVLVLGGREKSCKQVAHHYGFRRVVQPNDIYSWNTSVWPFKTTSTWLSGVGGDRFDFHKEPIQAIMMFHDSCDWGTDLQIAMDALLARDGYLSTMRAADETAQQIPLYFSNPDLLWSNDFPVPRFAQGAFRVALEALYKDVTGKKLEYTLFGKPETVTYQFAERAIRQQLSLADQQDALMEPLQVYAVGDNPAADIAGANGYGWTSILVRTGVFQGRDNDQKYPAAHVADHVGDAVRWAFEREMGV
ncbi:HAD-like domain-containing protein, partial [Thamnocephalis sphaerospora]